nr:hypothetical protein [Tanacetum cinerariifolium]
MTTPNVTSSTDSQMHNNIMAAGSRDRPPMLATRRYPQWCSRFLRYIDTRPNGEALRKCILSGPYIPTTIFVQAVNATDDSLAIPEHTTVKTPMNIFYTLMNEMIRNNLTVATMQVNVQFLQQLQPEWLRFVTIVKQQHKLDEVSYHNLFDILKQYQKEVNELRAERLARNANPLALVATAQANQDPYYQTSRNNNVDTTPQYKNDDHSGQFRNQRMVNVARAREKVGSPKAKKVKDSAYHKEKMLLCKQAEQGVPLQAEQYDWLADTDEEIDEQELEAHYRYNVFANDLQHFEQSESVSNICLVEMDDSNVIPDLLMCEDDIQNEQNDVKSDDERVALDNLIANLKLDSEFKNYKAFNDRTVDYDKLEHKLNESLGQLAQKDIEIKEGLKTKAYEISVVKEKHDELIKQSLLTKSHYEGLIKQKTKVIADLKLKEEHDIDKMLSIEKQLKFLNKIIYKKSQSIQTIHMMAPKIPTYNGRPTFANPRYLKQAQSEIPCLYAFPYDQSTHANRLILDQEETLALERERVNHKLNVSRPQHKSNQLKDKVLPNNNQVKLKKTQVEAHLRIPSVSNKIKFITACNDSLDSRTLNANAVCATCNKCLVDSNHFACVTKMLNDVNARTKKPTVVPISTRKPKSQAKISLATHHKKKVASKPTNQKPHSYYRMLYENTNKACKWWIAQKCPSGYKWVPKTKMQWVPKAKKENM